MPTTASPPPPNKKNGARDPVDFMQRWMSKSKGELVQCHGCFAFEFCHAARVFPG
jgi:hypothetical protein